MLGQAFVNTQSTFFNQTYGSLTDSQFINALYVNIGGNAGDPGGIAYWASLLPQAEAAGQSVQAARAGLVGQFVHDLIDVNLSDRHRSDACATSGCAAAPGDHRRQDCGVAGLLKRLAAARRQHP